MSYRYAGMDRSIRSARHVPASEDEARAKFAYFRQAEDKINGGPAPLRWRRVRVAKCGTNGGYMKHFRLGEERCQPCKAAHTQVELRRQREEKTR